MRYPEFIRGSYTSQSPITDQEKTFNWLDVFPCKSFIYVGYGLEGDSEIFSDCGQFLAIQSSDPNCPDVAIGEFGGRMIFTARYLSALAAIIVSMLVIVCGRNPFKIYRPIVELVAIFMINVMAFRPWAYEGFSDQLMDWSFYNDVILAKISGQVSSVQLCFANLAPNSAKSTEVANFISQFVSANGNPRFGHMEILPHG